MTTNEYGVAFRFYFPILHHMYSFFVVVLLFALCLCRAFFFHFRNDNIAHEIEPQQRHNNRKQFKEKQNIDFVAQK